MTFSTKKEWGFLRETDDSELDTTKMHVEHRTVYFDIK